MAKPLAPKTPGEKRAEYGSVSWLCAEYLASLDYLGRPLALRVRRKRYIDDFRAKRGELPVARLEQEHLEKMFAKLIDTPAAANQWLNATRDLTKYAIKRKLLAVNPALDIKKRAPKVRKAIGHGRARRSRSFAPSMRSAARRGWRWS